MGARQSRDGGGDIRDWIPRRLALRPGFIQPMRGATSRMRSVPLDVRPDDTDLPFSPKTVWPVRDFHRPAGRGDASACHCRQPEKDLEYA